MCLEYLTDCECENYDTIAVELHIGKKKWLCISIYRSTAYSLTGFLNEMENILNRAFCKYDYVIVMVIIMQTFSR